MGGGPGGDWREVEGCYVLYPPEGAPPRCLIEFIGGSFVGAAPQLAYRPLLEALAARGALVRPAVTAGLMGNPETRTSSVCRCILSPWAALATVLPPLGFVCPTPAPMHIATPGLSLQIVAVPYATGFDQLRLADEVHFRFERCLKALGPQAIQLSRYGVGGRAGGAGPLSRQGRGPLLGAAAGCIFDLGRLQHSAAHVGSPC